MHFVGKDPRAGPPPVRLVSDDVLVCAARVNGKNLGVIREQDTRRFWSGWSWLIFSMIMVLGIVDVRGAKLDSVVRG